MKKILTVLCCVTMLACTKDFEEINTNPNVPTNVTPNLLLAGVIRNTINDQVNEAWGMGNIVVQHTAKIQFVNEDRYLWGEKNGIWNSVYNNMRNVENIIAYAEAQEPVQNNYLGIALVLRAWMYANLTDAYGDIPAYTDAIKGKSEKIYLTTYDSQERVYEGILADLKKANEILGTSTEPVSGDLIYGGTVGNWKKLANSLHLRYLMRISDIKTVGADMEAIVNSAATPIFESNTDNALLVYQTSAPNQWPMYGSRVGSFDEFRLSKTLDDKLTALNDPRLAVFGRPTEKSVVDGTPEVVGVPNGLEDTQALDYNGGPQNISRVGYAFACLVCNDLGQTPPVANIARGLLMTYAELQFILAEAREKELITTGDAEAYYLNGIKANFDYYKAIIPGDYKVDLTLEKDPVTEKEIYFEQADVAYTGTQEEKLEKIGTQKWVALFFNGLEAWYDWRRTNIPALEPGVANLNNDLIPVRYIYPLAEQSMNTSGRAAAVSRMGGDNLNIRVWWDQE